VESVEAPLHRRVLDAVGPVLVLLPSRAEAEDEAPAGDVVDGGGHLRQHRRVPVGVAGNERTDRDPGDEGTERGEQGPPLVHRAGGVLGVRHEVVDDVEAVPPGGLGVEAGGEQVVPRLGVVHPEAEAHGPDRTRAVRPASGPQPGSTSRFSGTNWLAMNTAPWGSRMVVVRTHGRSVGSLGTVPPSAGAVAAAASASSTANVTLQCAGVSVSAGSIGTMVATTFSNPSGDSIAAICSRKPG